MEKWASRYALVLFKRSNSSDVSAAKSRRSKNSFLISLIPAYLAARVILRAFRWLFLFGFLYDFAVTLVGLAALALGIYMAVQLRKYGRVTQLPYVGKYTLIR